MSSRLNRRTTLRRLALGLAASISGRVLASKSGEEQVSAPTTATPNELYRQSLCRLGREYLKQQTRLDSNYLHSRLSELEIQELFTAPDLNSRINGTAIQALFETDFRDGRLVEVSHWVLSKLEAELYAAFALTDADRHRNCTL